MLGHSGVCAANKERAPAACRASGSAVPRAGSCTVNSKQLFSPSFIFCKSREGTRAGQDLDVVSGTLLTILWLCHFQYLKNRNQSPVGVRLGAEWMSQRVGRGGHPQRGKLGTKDPLFPWLLVATVQESVSYSC